MSIWISKRLRCLGVALAASASLCGSLPSLTAGEAIQFSPSKGKAEPGAPNNKLPKEKLSNLDRFPSSNPFDSANQARPLGDDPRRPKTKEETRRKLKELENKNWTAVEPGQLQEEEDEKTSMGVREYDIETGGKEKTASDIWLDRRSSDTSRSQGNPRGRGPASRGPGQSRPQPVRESDDSDSGLKIGNAGGQTAGQSAGAPGSKEPQLNNLLGSDPAPGGLRDTFKGGNLSEDQGRRGDLGLRSIEAPTGTRPTSLGGGDPLGFGRDVSARPALSAPSGLLDTPKSQPSSSFTAPGGRSPFGLSDGRYNSPSFNDPNPALSRGLGAGSSLQPQNNFTPGSSRDAFTPPVRPSSGR
jgi:hypothetical protein